MVELRGIEPLTFSLRTRRATNCATAPRDFREYHQISAAEKRCGPQHRPASVPVVPFLIVGSLLALSVTRALSATTVHQRSLALSAISGATLLVQGLTHV